MEDKYLKCPTHVVEGPGLRKLEIQRRCTKKSITLIYVAQNKDKSYKITNKFSTASNPMLPFFRQFIATFPLVAALRSPTVLSTLSIVVVLTHANMISPRKQNHRTAHVPEDWCLLTFSENLFRNAVIAGEIEDQYGKGGWWWGYAIRAIIMRDMSRTSKRCAIRNVERIIQGHLAWHASSVFRH